MHLCLNESKLRSQSVHCMERFQVVFCTYSMSISVAMESTIKAYLYDTICRMTTGADATFFAHSSMAKFKT